MEQEKSLFFTGHREVYRTEGSDAFGLLCATVRSFAEKGYIYFITGGAMGFDTMAAECVLKLKDEFPHIKLILMLPCREQTAKWGVWDTKKYDGILSKADDVIYVSENYTKECMFQRNRAMADASSACIAYCSKSSGGTAYTISYALKKGIPVTNLATAF